MKIAHVVLLACLTLAVSAEAKPSARPIAKHAMVKVLKAAAVTGPKAILGGILFTVEAGVDVVRVPLDAADKATAGAIFLLHYPDVGIDYSDQELERAESYFFNVQNP